MAAVQPELILHSQVYGGLETCSEVSGKKESSCKRSGLSLHFTFRILRFGGALQSKNKYIIKIKYISLLPFPEGRIQFAAH